MKPERAVIDVSDLPTVVFGHRGLIWWGTLGFMLIEGITLSLCIVSYFYLRRNFVVWPPHGTPNPDLLVPTLALVVMLVTVVPAHVADKSAKRFDRRGVIIALGVSAVLALVLLVLRWFEFRALNTRWDSNAYGSIAWTTLGLHASLLVIEAGEVIGTIALFLIGPIRKSHFSDAEDIALYWYFIVGSWIPLYLMLYLVPRWW
jgi:heme/copper-type cytochrome/quinol oxidase subunit 3